LLLAAKDCAAKLSLFFGELIAERKGSWRSRRIILILILILILIIMGTEGVFPGNIPKPYTKARYYTPQDVAKHNSGHDCWVSYFGQVFDLTNLLARYQGPLATPIINAAGSDISHWFNEQTRAPKTWTDPQTNCTEVYCPQGRYIHVPPKYPTSDWSTKTGTPWWKDAQYHIGSLAKKTRKVNVVNLLTKQQQILEIPTDETVGEIQERYLQFNFHAKCYTWKRLGKPLDMKKTLDENGVKDESEEMERLGIDPDDHIPALHLYFNDDLTEA